MTTCENTARGYRAVPGEAISRRAALGLIAGFPWVTRAALAGEPAPVPERLPRDQLLLYRTASGRIRRARRPAEWERRHAEILSGFERVAGPFPGRDRRKPPAYSIEAETDEGDHVRRVITYAPEADPNHRVSAYLLIPKSVMAGGRAPAALCLHQTHREGKKVVVGLGNSPHDEYGVELVRRGFVCLAPPYPLLVDYHPDLSALGYVSGTMKAVWDNVRGLDLLDSLPFVAGGRYAAIGHSLGGHNSIYTAVWDPRIRVVVTSCAFDSFLDYKGGDITGWTSNRYMPRLLDYKARLDEVPFDFHELVGALAPRAMFASAPLGDSNFQWQSVDRIAAAARDVYQLHGAEERLVVRHPDCDHRFPPEIREEAYAFIEHHLATA